MNQKLPYEQLIADKLQHLPLPDVDESWQEMKKLLDRELPPGGAGGRNGFSPRKWWWIGGAFIMLLGVGVISVYLNSGARITSASSALASENSAQSNQENNKLSNSTSTSKNSENNIDQKSTLKDKSSSIASNQKYSDAISEDADSKNTGNGDKAVSQVKNEPADNNTADSKSSPNSKSPASNTISPNHGGNAPSKEPKDGNSGPNSKSGLNAALGSGLANSGAHSNSNALNGKSGSGNNSTKNSGSNSNSPSKTNSNSFAGNSGQPNGGNPNSGIPSSSNKNNGRKNSGKNNGVVNSGAAYVYSKSYEDYNVNVVESSAGAQTMHYTNQQDWKNWGLYTNYKKIDESSVPYAPNGANAKSKGTLSKKDVEKQIRSDARKEKHEERVANRKPFWGEKTDRWFAAGLAPYQNFAIGPQEAYNYNSSANKGIATDYIPATYLQFHLTDRVYVLGEFQFNSPQATSSVLLSQKNYSQPGQNPYQQNVYLRKLYYFNMPLSLYYSPIKNFYLGSGLQFSSLNSGIAYMEQINPSNQLLYSETFKIKEDSLAAKLTGSEFRYLFDANYYWKRFMFGFRYNQALGDYINTQVNNTTSKARNQAFALYFRYNIIVSGRKGSQYDPMKY